MCPKTIASQLTAEALDYAKRVAFKMSKDPEVESVANFATLSALRSFNEEKGLSLKQWIAVCVKRGVWELWRKESKHKQVQKTEVWWERVVEVAPIESEPCAPPVDWLYLVEYYIDKVPLDVMAKQHKTTVYQVRQILNSALQRLRAKYED